MDPYLRSRKTALSVFAKVAPRLVWGAFFVAVALRGEQELRSWGATYRTANFIVHTSDERLAKVFAEAAEAHRHRLAIEWLGQPLPDWASPCVITAHVGPHLGAGGATSFVFDRGEVFGWRMTIQGSAERIVDSVLPHEITHMILASYFRRPIPRWADEGAATSVEHPAERAKYYRMLHEYLRTGQTIPLQRLFAMQEYPPNMLTLYAQGYVLADYLIQQGGRRKFVQFLETALATGNWEHALNQHYGWRSLNEFQKSWLAWVGQGSPPLKQVPMRESPPLDRPQLAQGKRPRPSPNLVLRLGPNDLLAPAEPLPLVPDEPLVAIEAHPAAELTNAPKEGDAAAEDHLAGTEHPQANTLGWPAGGSAPRGIIPRGEMSPAPQIGTSANSWSGNTPVATREIPGNRQPFAPGSIRPTPPQAPTAVQLGLPLATQQPSQITLR